MVWFALVKYQKSFSLHFNVTSLLLYQWRDVSMKNMGYRITYIHYELIMYPQHFLLTWINFNPTMEK